MADDEEAIVTIRHVDGQLFEAKFHEDAIVPTAIMRSGYNLIEETYQFEVCKSDWVESVLQDSGFDIVRTFGESYATVVPTVVHLEEDAEDAVLEVAGKGENVFFTGAGGTGKTELFCKVRDVCDGKVVMCAPTGTASVELAGRLGPHRGEVKTINAVFGIRIDDQERSIDVILNRIRAVRTKNKDEPFDVLMLDEASMVSVWMFELILRICKHINPKMQFIMCGDFAQLGPVHRADKDLAECGRFCFKSALWKSTFGLNQYELTHDHRVTGGATVAKRRAWVETLRRIRLGNPIGADYESLEKDHNIQPTDTYFRVYPRKKDAEAYNEERLKALGVRIREYDPKIVGYERPIRGDGGRQELPATPKEVEERLEARLENRRSLGLAVGARVMMVRNDFGKGLVNGSLGTVTSHAPNGVMVRFDTSNLEMLVTAVAMDTVEALSSNRRMMRGADVMTIPLELAWAGTVHKMQSKTVPELYINFKRDDGSTAVFATGQIYVALSRASNPDAVAIEGAETLESAVLVDDDVVTYYTETLPEICDHRVKEKASRAVSGEDVLGVPSKRRSVYNHRPLRREFLRDVIEKCDRYAKNEEESIKRLRVRLDEGFQA